MVMQMTLIKLESQNKMSRHNKWEGEMGGREVGSKSGQYARHI